MKIIIFFVASMLILLMVLKTAQAEGNNHKNNPKNTVLIFVSFSMPKQSLIAVLQEAQKIQAPVLLQGLVDNNFKTTFLRINELVKQAGGGGVSIDPTAFERYRITQVPTVVLLGESCESKISGDIPLFSALQHLQNHGDCASPGLSLAIKNLEGGHSHV